jgi:hypothetical protein
LGGQRRLTNPQGALAFDLVGPDPAALRRRPPPAFASREQAAEMAELYWAALLRDTPFSTYGEDPVASAAAQDLSRFTGYRGLRDNSGAVRPAFVPRSDSWKRSGTVGFAVPAAQCPLRYAQRRCAQRNNRAWH